jgi:ribosomal protein S18 acetylase RimI-like enzyme
MRESMPLSLPVAAGRVVVRSPLADEDAQAGFVIAKATADATAVGSGSLRPGGVSLRMSQVFERQGLADDALRALGAVPRDDAVVIRPAVLEDADAVGALTERVYRGGGWAGEGYISTLRDGRTRVEESLLYVATWGERIVGTATLALPGTLFAETARDHESEVRMLAVDAPARRHGAGELLLAVCEARSRMAGMAAVVLSTEPDMYAAHRLYRRRRYLRAPDRDWDADGFPILVYRRTLRSTAPRASVHE